MTRPQYSLDMVKMVGTQSNMRGLSEDISYHSRLQRPRSFWSALRIATSGQVQHRKSAIQGLPVTLSMLRVRSDKSDWF